MSDFNEVELYKECVKPFPAEAYSIDNSRGFALSSLKAQYIVERLNEVFGPFGWHIKGSFKEAQGGILYLGNLIISRDGEIVHEIEAIGFSAMKKNVGDVYKSARTDALSKAASALGIGNDCFKGLVEPKQAHTSRQNDSYNFETFKMPFGKNKGKPFKDIPFEDMKSAYNWCTEKKMNDLAMKIDRFIKSKEK